MKHENHQAVYMYLAIWYAMLYVMYVDVSKFIIPFKYWLMVGYNVCESDTSAGQPKVPFAVTSHIKL